MWPWGPRYICAAWQRDIRGVKGHEKFICTPKLRKWFDNAGLAGNCQSYKLNF